MSKGLSKFGKCLGISVLLVIGLLGCAEVSAEPKMKKGAINVICGERESVYSSLLSDKFTPFLLGQESEVVFNEIWVNYKDKTAIHLKTSLKENITCVTGTSQNVTLQVTESGTDI